jgi:acyl transferase domain-containing protein/thioesterase domain-containing protein/aryl carrier-like protein
MGDMDIAIIGMSGRFPKSRTLEEYWGNLRDGVECISFFSDDEMQSAGIAPEITRHPDYVKAKGVIDDADLFDAEFFGIPHREAAILDPQHRLFLQHAWSALEDAGYDSGTYAELIGVYAGSTFSSYLMNNLRSHRDLMVSPAEHFQIGVGNDKDFLTTRVSYKLNLKGPSVAVQTACSTSLVAVVYACQGLLNYQCDMALAGGVSISVPLRAGYLFQEGMMESPDGRCRAFDAKARGTVWGDGVGVVVLKRLAEALADGDRIRAVIKGTAVNNDGSLKVGYSAPSVAGQAEVIATAQVLAGVTGDTISYVETHGTGTPMGDPIEIAALTKAFRQSTEKRRFCAIGSVKPNIGHLEAAAGIAGLIKVVLALEHQSLPPSLHFEEPNPEIEWETSPFYVNTKLKDWRTGESPRRAGVSSFGIGGTNAHVVLEEAPRMEASGPSRPWQLLLLSGKTRSALSAVTDNLIEHIRKHPHQELADVAYTLQVGRKRFKHRRAAVCRDPQDAVGSLSALDPQNVSSAVDESENRPVIFMFSGQGSQYPHMAAGLYETEPTFREHVDLCAELLKPHLGSDLRAVLHPAPQCCEAAGDTLAQTRFTQPALFAIEYSLAYLLKEWGIRPQAMIGHSIGEYVAACLAGVFTLQDALALVAGRGRLIQTLPGGAMLAVPLPEAETRRYIREGLSIAAVNGPSACVVSGEREAIDALGKHLSEANIPSRRLHTSHAFHSAAMDPILPPFLDLLRKVSLKPPEIRYISNVTGTWVTPEQATDPLYWVEHLRGTVRFSDGIFELIREGNPILLEVGPGRTLATLAQQCTNQRSPVQALSSLRNPKVQESDVTFILKTVGRLWDAGANIDWGGFYRRERRRRVSLPTYPLELRRYWIDPAVQAVDLLKPAPSRDLQAISKEYARPELPTAYTAARNPVEETLAGIWRIILGVQEVGVLDNFFDLGGDSLSATRLVGKLRERFRKPITVADVFQHPTLERLASFLADGDGAGEAGSQAPHHTSAIKLREGRQAPMFIIPGNMGNVHKDLGFLVRHLPSDMPVYGMQDGIGHPSSIRKLAAHYVEEIIAVQPSGGYRITGICSGAVVAYEIAQQLVARNRTIELLAMIEPGDMSSRKPSDYLAMGHELLRRLSDKLLGANGHSSRAVNTASMSEKLDHFRMMQKLSLNLVGISHYKPTPCDHSLHLFLTNESLHQKRDGMRKWQEMAAKSAFIHEIPGTHRSITGDKEAIKEEEMRVIASKISALIHQAA